MGRPRIPYSVVRVALRAVASGSTLVEAAARAGISESTLVGRLREEPVGVLRDHQHRRDALSLDEREEIRAGIVRGESNAEIGRRLGRPRGTIWREIDRNGGRGDYRAFRAQDQADQQARRPRVSWTVQRAWLWDLVQTLLRTRKW